VLDGYPSGNEPLGFVLGELCFTLGVPAEQGEIGQPTPFGLVNESGRCGREPVGSC
jgi:hypothetical protein